MNHPAAVCMDLYEELGQCVFVGVVQTYGPETRTCKETMAFPDKKLWWESMCNEWETLRKGKGNMEKQKV